MGARAGGLFFGLRHVRLPDSRGVAALRPGRTRRRGRHRHRRRALAVPRVRCGRPSARAFAPRPLLWIAAGVAACSALVLILIWGTGLGQSESDLILYAAEFAALVGLAVAAVLAGRAVWPGRPTSLRTRAFFVIAVAVLIPSFCLALLGVWAYYRSWDAATSLYSGQASYQASEIASEIASVQEAARPFRARTSAPASAAAIAAAYGAQGHFEGAQLATLSQLRATQTLPVWALRSLARQGYAIGGRRGATDSSERRLRCLARQRRHGALLRPPVDRSLLLLGAHAGRSPVLDRGARHRPDRGRRSARCLAPHARGRAPCAAAGGGERPARRRRSRRHRSRPRARANCASSLSPSTT